VSRIFLIRISPLWVLSLVIGSLLPGAAKTALGTHVPVQHRLYHALAFGATAYLFLLIARGARERLYALLFTIGLAVAIEYLQYRISGGVFEWWDVRDDSLGVLAAVLIFTWAASREKLLPLS
jgi:hypothetical protein